MQLQFGDTVLQLPVEDSSNKTPTVWTTTGLSLTGLALADGPVWAYVWWLQGDPETHELWPVHRRRTGH